MNNYDIRLHAHSPKVLNFVFSFPFIFIQFHSFSFIFICWIFSSVEYFHVLNIFKCSLPDTTQINMTQINQSTTKSSIQNLFEKIIRKKEGNNVSFVFFCFLFWRGNYELSQKTEQKGRKRRKKSKKKKKKKKKLAAQLAAQLADFSSSGRPPSTRVVSRIRMSTVLRKR